MDKVFISFESSPDDVLIGFHHMQCEGMDELGNIEERISISIGFLFFQITIYIRK